MVRASVAAERAGVRSASIAASAFLAQARPVARSLGVSNLALAEYPGIIDLDSEDVFREKVGTVLTDRIIEALASPVDVEVAVAEPGPRDIVFSGSLAAVLDHFHQNEWSDGLPIVPPTIDKVEEFLQFTDRSADEVIGVLLPGQRAATVWNVAVNGVMAGCRPEYLPILLAVVEAMADPEFAIEHCGSTPALEPLVIVNGPIIKELNLNYESGTMRVGRQSNTSIGRFARLYMRNVAGLRQGSTDKGTLGFTFNVALAENEDMVAALGWKPFSVERGFAPGENVVTVQSVVAISPPFGLEIGLMASANNVARRISRAWGEGDLAFWSATGMFFDKWFPLLVVAPPIAKALAREGWSKDDLKRYLTRNAKTTAYFVEQVPVMGGTPYDLCRLVEEGRLPREYCESTDPTRLVPVFRHPEWIGIVVAGDPGIARVRGYTNNHEQGPPVSKAVKLPAKWRQLLDHAGSKR